MTTTQLQEFQEVSIRLQNGLLQVLDQRKLPDVEDWLPANEVEQMFQHIKTLTVRGAPLIGVAAAMSLAVNAAQGKTLEELLNSAKYLKSARPTAVNLMYCCDRIIKELSENKQNYAQRVIDLAYEMLNHEVHMNDAMASYGASLIKDGEGILTHCNTGALATPGKGTALGVIREAHAQGKKIHVYVDETRPLLQGGRLTAYELQKAGIPYTLICDNMAATLMRQGKIQRVLVGADRIAVNGDFANKIGTYSVAVLAKHHNIPFHPVAPASTVDLSCPSGEQIPIEERSHEEVKGASGHFGSVRWAPKEATTFNPAFDVTPVELVESLILDSGIYTRDQLKSGVLASLKQQHKS
mmetsp:Transcript_29160/g.41037  ORF Transcript_29160/g.41037 Transcript_29160/m.41037 type:complete len:354 (-) Transcript_29160:21-1082(-)